MDAERATHQQANSYRQRQTKKRTSQESEEETEPEDSLNLNLNKIPWQVILTMYKKLDRQNKGHSEKEK